MLKKFLLLASLVVTPALAQSVQQSGTVTARHLPYWVTSGVIGDGGSSTDSPISSIGVTNEGGAGFCVSSQRASAVGRNQLCFGASTAGPATISVQNYGTASPQGINFVINGTTVAVPTGGGTFIFGNAPFIATHVPCFLNSAGLVQDCGLALVNGTITSGVWNGTPVDLAHGGTGATSQGGAQTALGLGTMAFENSNNVSITGGAVTGMPSPVVASDVAIKSYVDATSSGLNILAPSTLASAAVLPNTPTYSNGTLGVGATLTSATNTTLTVDSTAAPLNTVVLVKNQASSFQNGVYTVTTAGSGAAQWVLTRATYFDQAAEMRAGSYTFVNGGVTNLNAAYTLQTAVTTVGTDPLNFVQFSAASTGTVTSATIAAGTGISVTGTCTITASGTCTVANTGATSIAGNNGAFTLNGASGLTNTVNDIKCFAGSSSQFGCVEVDNVSILASAGVLASIAATKAQQQTGTDNNVNVKPAHQQDHDSALKAHGCASISGTTLTNCTNNYNGNWARSNIGVYVWTFSPIVFASTNYDCTFASDNRINSEGNGSNIRTNNAIVELTFNSSFVASESTIINIQCAGRQ